METLPSLEKDDAKNLSEFNKWVDQIHRGATDPQLRLEPMPSPSRLAPYANAVTTELMGELGEELASGRLVFLFNPDGVKEWAGERRFVLFARASLESEIANDPLASEVGWSWLQESLDRTGSSVTALSGTVTRTSSESFGSLSERAPMGVIEIRASWTPLDEDLSSNGAAWTTLLRLAAGMPIEADVTHLPKRDRA